MIKTLVIQEQPRLIITEGIDGVNKLEIITSGGSGDTNAVWGGIDGNIENQNDLQTALGERVPYTGATEDVDLDAFSLSAKSISVNGTNGEGHIHLKHQASDATANGSSTVIFADVNGDIKYKNDGGFYTTHKTSANTANRTYTYPDRTGTLADNTDLATKQNSLTLTTTGSTGAATLVGSTLNIPQYSSGGAVTVQDYTLQTADPSAPSAGTAKLYVKQFSASVVGKPELTIRDAFNNSYSFETKLGKKPRSEMRAVPNSGGSPTVTGCNFSHLGSSTNSSVPSSGSLYTSLPRAQSNSAAAINSSAGTRINSQVCIMSTGTYGGFDDYNRFAIAAYQANSRGFFGLNDALISSNAAISTRTNIVGAYYEPTDTNLKMICKGTGSATTVDLGANFPCNTSATDVYTLRLFNSFANNTISYHIVRENTGHEAFGEFTSNQPANGTSFYKYAWLNTNTGTVAVSLVYYHQTTE